MPLSDKAEKYIRAIRFSWIKQSLEFWDIRTTLELGPFKRPINRNAFLFFFRFSAKSKL